jgi:transcriptional antiterminator RfaH
MNRWFLIYCKPNQEARAEINLTRQGFTIYRPTANLTKQAPTGRQTSVKAKPLFPRYLFINVDPEVQSVAPIASTLGVVQIVRFGSEFACASDRLINEIKMYEQKRQTEQDYRDKLVKGDVVFLDTHGFDQIKAIYCNPCGDERAMILMNILGNQSKVSVPLQSLSKQVPLRA